MGHARNLLLAVLLGINIDLDLTPLLERWMKTEPSVTCGLRYIGFRFVGRPKQVFEYGNQTYEIGAEGWVELLAEPGRRGLRYRINNVWIPLQTNVTDPFGFVVVGLPETAVRPGA